MEHFYIKHLLLFCGLCLHNLNATTAINKTVTEGTLNTEIDCQFSRLNIAPIWKINNSLYDTLSLAPLSVQWTTSGLKITVTDEKFNQTSFQCFKIKNDGLNVDAGNLVHLNLLKNATFHPPKVKLVTKISLDYLRFMFNTTHKTIAWKFENNQTCKPPVTFAIQSLGGDQIKTWNTFNLEYSLPVNQILNEDDEPLYLVIIAYNATLSECVRTSPFQVHQNVTSKEYFIALGDDSCLNVPRVSPSHTLSAVWADTNKDSCTCPLCYSSDGECVFEQCHCYNSSSFAPTMSIGHSNNAQLCWSNINGDRNNSVIHFFTETIFYFGTNRSTELISTFISSTRFLVMGPPLPPNIKVHVDQQTIEICLSVFSHFPIISYEMNVTDFMGDKILNHTTSENCIIIWSPKESDLEGCTPYMVSARAYNKVGGSNISSINVNLQEGIEDHCSCVNKKINFNLSEPIVTSNLAKLQLTCQRKSYVNATVTIELLLTTKQGVNKKLQDHQQSITCNGNPVNLQYNNLTESTTYNIVSVWNVNNDTYYCEVEQFITGTSNTRLIDVSVTASVAVLLLLVMLLLLLLFCLCSIKKYKRIHRNSYEPLNGNEQNSS